MQRPLPLISLLAPLIFALSTLTGCGRSDSPEQQVRTVIDQMEAAAEARDVSALSEHVSKEYRDANDMTADDVARYVRGYFIANQSIHLLTRIDHIEFPFPEEARVQVAVGMLGRGAADSWDLAVDSHQFRVTLRQEEGDWKVTFAEWSRSGG